MTRTRWIGWLGLFMSLGLLLSPPQWSSLTWAEEPSVSLTPKNFLWKVESPLNTVYLLGSIHVLQQKNYPLAPAIYNAFNQCGTIMFEVDLGELSSPMAQLQLLTKGVYVTGDTLKTVLAPERYEKAKNLMAERGHNIENFHRMKPWMAATAVTALELQKMGFEGEYGVDRHMFEKAQESKVDIVGLETVEYQLGLFENLPLHVQEYFLLQSLEDLTHIETRIQEMVKAWEGGQVQALESLLAGMEEYPELYQSLVVTRNQKWLPQIEQRLQKRGPVFVVVGALHLLGEEGLLAALARKGYRVEQM
ncbi:MAG: TraB/GumN family protein [Nitrospira sp.]|nr:TraB/GumN family protein [Nitrospira sp.]MCA9464051.1 TraB/GumN family protein [Nitrospira sp.]MCA9481065.1 TraB/GumN family protein [Nitrospira sp.]MCB9711570.1 TraB/GumN family protein [Nitrospiraceae bacterium]MDR4487309.1 TraB/GumN family protein [Nitrospirales bacterium]